MESKKKSRVGAVVAVVALVAVLAACLILYVNLKPKPAGGAGGAAVTVEVVHGDGTVKEFSLTTEQQYLGPALVEGGVVEDNQGTYGLYILTADGETVDESKQEWWCITQNGVLINYGADEQPIQDGEHYELTFTVGYDF